MTLNTILKKFLLISLLVFLIIGLTGCKTEFDPEDLVKFNAKPANFWDGLEHGVKLRQLPESCLSTPGYKWGNVIGVIWSFVFMSIVYSISVNESDDSGGCLGSIIGYWLGIGFYWLIVWLVQSVGIFFKWLASYGFS